MNNIRKFLVFFFCGEIFNIYMNRRVFVICNVVGNTVVRPILLNASAHNENLYTVIRYVIKKFLKKND